VLYVAQHLVATGSVPLFGERVSGYNSLQFCLIDMNLVYVSCRPGTGINSEGASGILDIRLLIPLKQVMNAPRIGTIVFSIIGTMACCIMMHAHPDILLINEKSPKSSNVHPIFHIASSASLLEFRKRCTKRYKVSVKYSAVVPGVSSR
jgi:hypothetical protein